MRADPDTQIIRKQWLSWNPNVHCHIQKSCDEMLCAAMSVQYEC